MEEERGHFDLCQRILTLGLRHCPYHEALMLKGALNSSVFILFIDKALMLEGFFYLIFSLRPLPADSHAGPAPLPLPRSTNAQRCHIALFLFYSLIRHSCSKDFFFFTSTSASRFRFSRWACATAPTTKHSCSKVPSSSICTLFIDKVFLCPFHVTPTSKGILTLCLRHCPYHEALMLKGVL